MICLVVVGSRHPAGAQDPKGSPSKVSETVMNGWRWFHVYCFRCHGVDALGSQLAPNLRQSIQNLSHVDFIKTVRDGKPQTAMQSWHQLLDDSQIEDIYQYVLARSEGRLGRGRPDEQ
jgi:mono/diheme cytochrome c family protein